MIGERLSRLLQPERIRQLFLAVLPIFTLLALVKIWPLLEDYDTVRVKRHFESDKTVVDKLDRVLLDQLAYLARTRIFDQSLAGGERTLKIDKPFWMDRCEVRQGDFYKFAQWQPFYPDRVKPAPRQPPDWQYFSESRDHTISGRLNAPANAVTWFDAYAYCHAAGGRLPTLGEWIAAAGGTGQRLYPWGDDFISNAWPYFDPLLNATQKCGLHPATDTPEGLADMGNNVSEWVNAGNRSATALVIGGNAFNTPGELYSLTMLWRQSPAAFRSPYIGFRCTYDEKPGANTTWRTELEAREIPAGNYPIGITKNARLPRLVTTVPSDRLDLIQRIFRRGNNLEKPFFYMTANEITRRQYVAFLRDPFVKLGLYSEPSQPKNHNYEPPDWHQQRKNLTLAVTNIDWWSAYAFAAWAGGRLPTVEEWASAASGQGQRLYPWGETFDPALTITAERGRSTPLAPADHQGDATPEGIYNLGGNVSEWTGSVGGANAVYSIVIKGGNYLLPGKDTTRFDYARLVVPQYRSKALGFRIVFDTGR